MHKRLCSLPCHILHSALAGVTTPARGRLAGEQEDARGTHHAQKVPSEPRGVCREGICHWEMTDMQTLWDTGHKSNDKSSTAAPTLCTGMQSRGEKQEKVGYFKQPLVMIPFDFSPALKSPPCPFQSPPFSW